ncbi:conserved hypothetical protein [Burkholderia sp. 8Y]|nr:conserved hypothetical protein [Burkholderia sp. 8Y]
MPVRECALQAALEGVEGVEAPAAGAALAGAASDDDALPAFALSPEFELPGAAWALSPDLGAAEPLLPPRKSVTYQPEPFNWNPAAVTCLENASFPQAGHCVSGASLIF